MADYNKSFVVREQNGQPVVGATVSIQAGAQTPVTLTTDASGRAVWLLFGSSAPPTTVQVKKTGFTTTTLTGGGDAWYRATASVILARDNASFAGWAYVVEDGSGDPVTGAAVWVNDQQTGVSLGAPTPGKVWIEGPRGAIVIRVVKNGQYPDPIRMTVGPNDPAPGTIRAVKTAVATNKVALNGSTTNVSVEVYNQAPGEGQVLYETVPTDDTGRGQTSRPYPVGQALYCVAKRTGYDPQIFTTTVPATFAVVVPALTPLVIPVEDAVTGLSAVGMPLNETMAPPSTTSPTTPVPAKVDPYEWLYPHSDDGKYFTTTQARMYIGNLFIDELNTVQFTYQGNRIPVYGYSSEHVDAFGSGRRLVHGQILLNFISEGYLFTVLSEYQKKMAQQNQSRSRLEENTQKVAALRQQLALQLAGIRPAPSPGYQGAPAAAEAAAALQREITATMDQITALSAETPAALDQLGARGKDRTTSVNATGLKVRFDIVLTLEGGGRTVTRKLEDCVLVSNEQVYDQSGTTLLDAYGFIARRLV